MPSKYSSLSLYILIILIFNSCSTPKDELDKKINLALRNDNVIDKNEWEDMKAFVLSNPEDFPLITKDQRNINIEELNSYILDVAEKRRNVTDVAEIYNPNKTVTQENNEKAEVNVYIENSASMDGYVNKTTEFEAALSDLLVQIQYRYDSENLNVNFINTKIHKSEITEVNDFVEKLEPSKSPYKVGDRSVSKLNEVLEIILDSTSQNNISVFISDCIYSLGKAKETIGALEFQKSLTKGVFLEKSKEFNFSTIILKMESRFNGKYYDKDDKPTLLTEAQRPYYIWVIGSDQNVLQFSKTIDLEKLKGFVNSYYLLNDFSKTSPYTTVLRNTNLIGRFRPIDKKSKTITGINELEYRNAIFQFAVAIDLSGISVDDDYLTSIENYIVSEGFKIRSIDRIDASKVHKNDWIKLEKTSATHIITISFKADNVLQDLEIELPVKAPNWISASSSIDDKKIKNQLSKTFGLKYLLEGVSEAYYLKNGDEQSYIKTKITIKK